MHAASRCIKPVSISLKMNNTREKKYEEICRVANRDFRVRRIG